MGLRGIELLLIDRMLTRIEMELLESACAGRAKILTADALSTDWLSEVTVLFSTRSSPWRLQELRSLRWIHSWGSGVDKWEAAGVRETGVAVTSAPDISSDAVADHAVAGMLWFQRQLGSAQRMQAQHRWEVDGDGDVLDSLHGKTVTVIGYGSVGKAVVRRVLAFGMEVRVVRRQIERAIAAQVRVFSAGELGRALENSAFAVLAVPLTAATQGMIGEAELAALGPTGVLINVARGRLVDERALERALETGVIAGAVLDVASEEPLRATSPLWDFAHVLITPHVAWRSKDFRERAIAHFATLLRSYLTGGVQCLQIVAGRRMSSDDHA